MKIILSRKGFDSGTGGKPSPILPDGSMVSLPIPDDYSKVEYRDLNLHNVNLGQMVSDLTHQNITGNWKAHLDPDLTYNQYPRQAGWTPLFGQAGAAQTHLIQSGVGPGDLFLFFGWFRAAEKIKGHYQYVKNAPDLHVLFGWLQIGKVISVRANLTSLPNWMTYHPHVHYPGHSERNTLYIASERLTLPGLNGAIPGAGSFTRFSSSLCLTAPGLSRSNWHLPVWFYPVAGRAPLTYHSDLTRWKRSGDHVILKSAARGQEFILNADEYPESGAWLNSLFTLTKRV